MSISKQLEVLVFINLKTMKIENYTDLVSLCTTPDQVNIIIEQTFTDEELYTASKDEFEKLYKYAAGRLKELGWTSKDAIKYVFKLKEEDEK